MKINQARPRLEHIGTAVVFRVASTSRPGMYHYVQVYQDGNGIKCSCEGFVNHGRCWHTQEVPLCQELEPYECLVKVAMPSVRECHYAKFHHGPHSWETHVVVSAGGDGS